MNLNPLTPDGHAKFSKKRIFGAATGCSAAYKCLLLDQIDYLYPNSSIMKQKPALLLFALLFSTRILLAQGGPTPPAGAVGSAYESQASCQRQQVQAVLLDVPYPDDVMEQSIKDYMFRFGYRSSGGGKGILASGNGFMVFRN